MKKYFLLLALFITFIQNELRGQTCSGTQTLTANTGTFSDRISGDVYSDNLDCRWLIQPSGGRRITLSFTRFNTEQNVDFVTIYDGSTINDRVLGRFSGSTLPGSVASSSGVILIRFTSDAFVGTTGWTASYVTESESTINPSQILWQKVNALGDRNISCLEVFGNTLFVGTNGSGIFRSSDNGTTWSVANNGLGTNLSVSGLAANSTNIFAIARGSLLTSVDLGNSWVGASTATTITAVITHRDWVYIISGGDVLRSTNNSATWQNISNTLFARSATSIISDGTRLFVFSQRDTYVSNDNGNSWQLFASTNNRAILRPVILGNDLFGIFFDGTSGIACGTSGLLVNRNIINTWNSLSTIINPTILFALGKSNLFAGTCTNFGGRIFVSTNNGSTWTQTSNGIPTGLSVGAINTFIWTGQVLYVGTAAGGLFRTPLAITTSVSAQENINPNHRLSLFPNPIADAASIHYTLSTPADVRLELYSALGVRLMTLIEERQGAGNYVVPVDVRHLPSGQYYYRLRVGVEQTIRSLQVVR